jgi:hypothetical protein
MDFEFGLDDETMNQLRDESLSDSDACVIEAWLSHRIANTTTPLT